MSDEIRFEVFSNIATRTVRATHPAGYVGIGSNRVEAVRNMHKVTMTHRLADCIEQHLHEYGWKPYRYPSGEHKGIVSVGGGEILLVSDLGSVTKISVSQENS